MKNQPSYAAVAIAPQAEALLANAKPQSAAPLQAARPERRGQVARASVMGVLFPEYLIALRRWLLAMGDDDRVAEIFLEFDSPGGYVGGVAETAEVMRRVREKKPIIVAAEGVLASAAFWIGAQATRLYASPSTIVGSVGARALMIDSSEAMAAAGLKFIHVATSPTKIVGAEGAPIEQPAIDLVQRDMDNLLRMFQEDLLKSGRMNAAQVAAASDGDVYLAADAQRRGLIDQVRLVEDVAAELGARAIARDPFADLWDDAAYAKYRELAVERFGEEFSHLYLSDSQAKRMAREFPTLAERANKYEEKLPRNQNWRR